MAEAKFQKRHYEALAQAIREEQDSGVRHGMTQRLVNFFTRTQHNFKPQLFVDAAMRKDED